MHLKRCAIDRSRFPVGDQYPFSLRVLRAGALLDFNTPVTFFVGENGSGKSTLLRAIARACGIHIWEETERARTSRNPHEEQLHLYVEVEWAKEPVPGSFFSADRFRSFSQSVDEWAIEDPEVLGIYGGKSLLVQSHGQSHMSFFMHRFRIEGLYLLDEPENALSPKSQVLLRRELEGFGRCGNAQFLIATHSPILLSLPGAAILDFDGEAPRSVAYQATEHYRIYKSFFEGEGRQADG
jgi:predicted ATPase